MPLCCGFEEFYIAVAVRIRSFRPVGDSLHHPTPIGTLMVLILGDNLVLQFAGFI